LQELLGEGKKALAELSGALESWDGGEVHSSPCTFHPTPYTLHSFSFTLQPAPYTLHPAPYTLHPTPYFLHPTPHTLHPGPFNLHPAPYTLNPSTPHALQSDVAVKAGCSEAVAKADALGAQVHPSFRALAGPSFRALFDPSFRALFGPSSRALCDPSLRALSGRLKLTVQRHQFNNDSLPQVDKAEALLLSAVEGAQVSQSRGNNLKDVK